jgi:hypothetical protein
MPPPRRRTRKRPQGGKGGSRRGRPGGSKNKRSFKQFRDRNKKKSNVATGGSSTARESGIMANQTKDRIKSLEQSVGSLDRRIENALKAGNLDLVKDLRSRQNVFTTRLGDERAIQAGGVMRTGDGSIIRTSDGRPVFNNKGLGVFNQTKDMDFLDPTRKLQNENPEAFAKMYPITNRLNRGLPGVAFAKEALGIEDKPIAYTDDDMPGVRYPLDKDFGAGEGEPAPIMIDDFDKALDVAPDAVPSVDITGRATDVAPPGVPFQTMVDSDQPSFPTIVNPTEYDSSTADMDKEVALGDDGYKTVKADTFVPKVVDFADAQRVNPKLLDLVQPSFAELDQEFQNESLQQKEPPKITTMSGSDFATQVAENNAQLKQNVIANPELNNQQKEMILNEIDSRTGFQPITDQTSLLPTSNADQVIFDQYITDALNRMGQPQVVPQEFNVVDPSIVDPAAEADALETLNSLSQENPSLFQRILNNLDADTDRQGFQLFNLNPNR